MLAARAHARIGLGNLRNANCDQAHHAETAVRNIEVKKHSDSVDAVLLCLVLGGQT